MSGMVGMVGMIGMSGMVEHVCVGELDQEKAPTPDGDQAWLLHGDQELLHQELWGKVHREHVLRSHVPFNASCEH